VLQRPVESALESATVSRLARRDDLVDRIREIAGSSLAGSIPP